MRTHLAPAALAPAALALAVLAIGTTLPADDWPGWRGPHHTGHTREQGLPKEWSADDVTWKAKLEGWGQSSPVVSGDRVFITTALQEGAKRVVLCFDRNTGEKLWEKTAWTGQPEPTHRMNGWASATCATDGERVLAFFGKGGGLFCYGLDGDLQWQAELGDFDGPWGTAACPVIVGTLVVQNCDSDGDSFLTAFDKVTGKQVWRVARPKTRGWSTPILQKVGGRDELILNGHYGVVAYDPLTGTQLWTSKDERGRGSPTATPIAGGRIALVSGRDGGRIYAVEPGGSGEKQAVWSNPRKGGRDLPSPISLGGQLLIVNMKGILASYDSLSGEEFWRGRIDGEYSAAPIAYDGHAFFVNEAGRTIVVRPGKELDVVATNDIGAGRDEIFRASITPSDGQLFLRSDKYLYCVGKRNQ